MWFALIAILVVGVAFGPRWFGRLGHPLQYQGVIADNAAVSQLDPYLVCAVINVESGFDASEESAHGAIGLMQVLPATAREVVHREGLPLDVTGEALKAPATNIAVGTRYMGSLLRRYGKVEVMLAAYNAGPVKAGKWVTESDTTGKSFIDVIDYPATRGYVAAVLSQRDSYSALYPSIFEEASR